MIISRYFSNSAQTFSSNTKVGANNFKEFFEKFQVVPLSILEYLSVGESANRLICSDCFRINIASDIAFQ
jgi:hypothetical protein